MDSQEQMHLGVLLYPSGYHLAAWRLPTVPADMGVNILHYSQVAKKAEAGKLDFLFFADSLAIQGENYEALGLGAHRYVAQFEPLSLISALGMITKKIGLVASATTTYYEPYHLARLFSSIDHITNGRAGWNLVTSQNEYEAYNFGFTKHPEHDFRYARADEFIHVVRGLWSSWDEDAFIRDKKTGTYFDHQKLHQLNHNGTYFSVKGPLNIPRSPQGHPIILQAGSSEAGKTLGAKTADVIFTAQNTFVKAKEFYQDIKYRLQKNNRSPNHLKIIVGLMPFIGKTRLEAEKKVKRLQSLITPRVGLSLLSEKLGIDLNNYPIDEPLPLLKETNNNKSRQELLINLARDGNLTIKQLYEYFSVSRGHWHVIGTPDDIANKMEEWFLHKAADGFVIMPPYLPGGFDDFVELVIPKLQKKGIFREEYAGNMLREHLNIPCLF